ncbi:acyl-CoA synthetase FdrA [Paenibacillus sp.]|uniref:acyl-CoA synthetase FdrA n=1 Tax=Paenibacillus sp. TaxID=58172 RepID=UPI0028A8525D|nr:acyl-CoA synthetase FdrA [Paenibacillus sp.]
MLYTVIKPNSYQDSVSLMLLTNKLSEMEGIRQISVMMGTPANKDIFKNSGLLTPEVEAANPNDICIVVDTEDEGLIDGVLKEADEFLQNQATKSQGSKLKTVRTLDSAVKALSDANIAIISIAGQYAAQEAKKAVERGLHVFIFSDNVDLDAELELKTMAKQQGTLVMGPDCGTGIISGIPLAFANVVNEGNIGIVGASGTGIQEVTTQIERLGGGISHAIGTGGRDLSETISATTAIQALEGLASDPNTDVIVLISKPPAPEVKAKVVAVMKTLGKPVVAIFMGDRPLEQHDNISYAYTLEDTAIKAVELAKSTSTAVIEEKEESIPQVEALKASGTQQKLKGFYSGGTLAAEAAMLLADAVGGHGDREHKNGFMFHQDGHEIIDLGDDAYTQGRPHPMIDPRLRVDMILEAARNPETAVILLDVVLGYGSHEDPAGALIPAITKAISVAASEGRGLAVIASVCGTMNDPQVYDEQVAKLKEAGVIVRGSNADAVRLAVSVIRELDPAACQVPVAVGSEAVNNLLASKPKVINIGLRHFADTVLKYGGQVVQYDWSPIAGGNERLAKILALLK